MNEFLDTVTDFLIDVASTVLISLICILIKRLMTRLTEKIENERLNQALKELESTIIDGIYYMEQTLVSSYKKNKSWNEETQKEVLDCCLEYVQHTLTETSKKYLTEDTKNSLESLIRGKIEARLGEIHSDKKEA